MRTLRWVPCASTDQKPLSAFSKNPKQLIEQFEQERKTYFAFKKYQKNKATALPLRTAGNSISCRSSS